MDTALIAIFFRLVEEVRQKLSVVLKNEDIYMAAIFSEFVQKVCNLISSATVHQNQSFFLFQMVRVFRGLDEKEALEVDYAVAEANGMQLKMPHQLFINNQFLDSSDAVEYDTINPADESVRNQTCCERPLTAKLPMKVKGLGPVPGSSLRTILRGAKSLSSSANHEMSISLLFNLQPQLDAGTLRIG